MKRIDSEALLFLNRALGLTGAGAAVTELTDGTVDQVIDITSVVRRGLTPAVGEGIFTGILRNVHTDAQSLATSINPYVPVGAAVGFYPSPVPPQFDVWLLAAGVGRTSGAGTLSAILDIQIDNQGFGVDDGGTQIVTNPATAIAHWDAVVTEGFTFGVQAGSEEPWARLNLRIPRSRLLPPLITFRSTSSLTSTYQCQLIMGVFPVSLGQDVTF